MKALILAGGKGTRLRPITYSIAKQLVPVANKPVIEYGIEAIRETGIEEFGFIVGDAEADIRAALGDGSRWNARFTYIRQEAPLGLAHAVATAREFLGESRFIVFLGDNLVKGGITELVDEFRHGSADASILLCEVPNPQEFGVAEIEGERVVRLVEKPKEPKSNFALVGVYLFTPKIFEAIEGLQPSFRGEYEITDAIQGLIDRGCDVRFRIVTGWWKDTGTVEAMLDANRLLLSDLVPDCKGVVRESQIEGAVQIGEGSLIERSTIRGPVVLGAGCVVRDAFVGPFTSIADDCTIEGSELEYSIVMHGSSLLHLAHRVSGSLIGRGVVVESRAGAPRVTRLVLGDHSSVQLP
ncbi:MAG: glucose-1-phosphate thymidylyltransferase [Armatimonadetes bacterium]|nr:MAG: glucose-1-phosphate thymidylyltransferase [Armatimonadota bacterium]